MITNQYDHKIEAAVLGAIILEKDALERVIGEFRVNYFEEPKHQIVARAILAIRKEKGEVDSITVSKKIIDFGQRETVSPVFVSSLTDRVASSAHIHHHLHLLKEMFLRRAAKAISQRTIIKLAEPGQDVFNVISDSSAALQNIQASVVTSGFDTIDSLADGFLDDLESRRSGVIPAGIKYGLSEMDRNVGGANKTDLIILAARPGMGKTAFALKIARSCAIAMKKPCGIFSLEMSSEQLLSRIMSAETRIDSTKFRGQMERYEINHVAETFKHIRNVPLYIDDTGGMDIYEFRNRARKMKTKYGVEEIIVDYLQLLRTTEYKDKVQQVTHISGELKAAAKELNIPIIALSQLSRAVEQRPDKRPMLSDLRDSGAIEQDADQIIFLYRPEYYGDSEIEINGNVESSAGKCLVDVAKNRHGRQYTGLVNFYGEFMDFQDLHQ